jgi:ATP-binding cassette subfamily B protein
MPKKNLKKTTGSKFSSLIRRYSALIALLVILAFLSSGLNLIIPKIIAQSIDDYSQAQFSMSTTLWLFVAIIIGIFIFSYLQNILQTFTSEKVARDLRNDVSQKISEQSYSYVQKTGSSKLLTNLTSDIDSVKQFVSQGVVFIFSAIFMLIGASVLLFSIDWQLALSIFAILPIIALSFFFVFRQMRVFFKKTQEIIDWLNRIISENIFSAALVRVLNSQTLEAQKFLKANQAAKDTSMEIVRLASTIVPIITFIANLATLIIVAMGGHYVIIGKMSLGDFSAFNNYVALLIFPIIQLGIVSNIFSRADASFQRIQEVLAAEIPQHAGQRIAELQGNIQLKQVSVVHDDRQVVKDVSFTIRAGSKTAIIGPTASGKTQLLYLLTGLIQPETGEILYDGHSLQEYDPISLHRQVSFVFQDSILFNLSIRENIAFDAQVDKSSLQKAIETAELEDFINRLPKKLDTVVSERGASLSGGQKQRIMLARALALNPKILLLDDFTARVDTLTEQKIIQNIEKNYPDLTLISVTQKIASIKNYDRIIVLMEGEVIASGKHEELLKNSAEYVQIYNSQKSTQSYEIQPQ